MKQIRQTIKKTIKNINEKRRTKHLMSQFEKFTKKLIFGPKINKNSQNRQNENFP